MERCKPRKDYDCMPMHKCMPSCEPMPTSGRRCIGTYSMKYRVYENCEGEYETCRICACCGSEYDEEQDECPMCSAPSEIASMDNPSMDDDPPRFGRFGGGFGGGFGGRFGGRFGGGFFPRFGFFPFFFPFRRFRRFRQF